MEKKLDKLNYSSEKQWKYRAIDKQILSQLTDALILFKMKTGNQGDFGVETLRFDNNREIVFSKKNRNEKNKKGPVDVLGDIEKIHILDTKKTLFETLDESKEVEEKDKEHYKRAINTFIANQFINSRSKLEKKKKNSPHYQFRKYYNQFAKEQEPDPKKQLLYRDVALSLANILYEKEKSYLNRDGEINEKGLKEIANVFLRTIKNIPFSGSSKSFHKIFHDGDFNFLRKENENGEPIVGKLDHYIQAIIYLMDIHGFNAYAENGEQGSIEWMKSKKSFLNNLFVGNKLDNIEFREKISDKKIIHSRLSPIRQDAVQESLDKEEGNNNRRPTHRLKSEASTFQKLGGKSENIQDESGLRVVYYGGDDHSQEAVESDTQNMLESYFEKLDAIDGLSIESLQLDSKGSFISSEGKDKVHEILDQNTDCENISHRLGSAPSTSKLSSLNTKYRKLVGKKPSPGLEAAYEIANNTRRGSNGEKYQDFKIIAKYNFNKEAYNAHLENNEPELEKDTTITQEISFYPYTNDLNMGNHHFLDLEKKIFLRVKNMNDGELGKSISLNRLRYFTETTLKDISFDIDLFEEMVKKGSLHALKNDDYAYLNLDGERISLRGLLYRNEKNSERFDILIAKILNYFIKKNKICYLNKEKVVHHGLITPEMLRDPDHFKTRRFLTSDVLRNMALDAKNAKDSICFYTENANSYIGPNFYNVPLGDLGDFINLEYNNKHN